MLAGEPVIVMVGVELRGKCEGEFIDGPVCALPP